MLLKPNTFSLTILLGLLTAYGPISTDMYLPSLPEIREVFNTNTAKVQLTLSVFLFGFAFGQIIYGPLSDRIGRKPILIASLFLFTGATLLCVFAQSIETLIISRFIQATAAAGPTVLARAVVRDLYSGARASKELAHMGSIMGFVPAIAPFFGGLLQQTFNWKATFYVIAIAAFLGLIAVIWMLPETLKEKNVTPISLKTIRKGIGGFLTHPTFLAYLGIACVTFGGLFAFISGASFVLQDIHHLSPIEFAMSFSCTIIGYIIGTILVPFFLARRTFSETLGIGCSICAIGGLSILPAVAVDGGMGIITVVLSMVIYMIGLGIVLPQSIAGALTPFPANAGAASSLFGAIQTCFGALVGLFIGHSLGGTAWPLALTIAFLGVMTFIIFIFTHKARAISE